MSKYTIELGKIVKTIDIFKYEYEFYDNDLKKKFEEQFIDNFYFHEIGYETVEKFMFHLGMKLNNLAPRYKQLYNIELKAKDINFLYNKDLKETFIREIDNSTLNNTDSITSDNADIKNKESNVENGNSYVDLTRKNLTSETLTESTNDTTTKVNHNLETNVTEKTELLSQGNIGVTTSGDLLNAWRESIIDLNMMLLEELETLFMRIY